MRSTVTFTSLKYDDILRTLLNQDVPEADDVYTASRLLGRNYGPALLRDLHAEDALSEDAAERLVGGAWSDAEYPQDCLDDNAWRALFSLAGYTVDGIRRPRPLEAVVLYRGCAAEYKTRWSWTDSREVAEHFAEDVIARKHGPQVWRAKVDPWRLFCVERDGRAESEFVIDTAGLRITAVGQHR